MLLSPWSIALSLLSALVIALSLLAGITAIKVIRFWDLSSDSNRQIRLENETWLASTLVQYALAFQIISLLLFVLAADQFSQVIAGAMCATGSFTANVYGLPALAVKLVGLFLYGFWIVLNQFDISSENYPLLKQKYIFLLALLPILILDVCLQTLYILKLEPDIITSCCAVVFGESSQSSSNLLGVFSQPTLLTLFYGAATLILTLNYLWYRCNRMFLVHANAAVWIVFLPIAFVAITTVFSSYVYAMPYHRCPFCIIKKEYYYIGLFQYITLLGSVFFGVCVAPISMIVKNDDLQQYLKQFIRFSVYLSSILLVMFIALTSYHLILYRFAGGES
nr:hypothetical protein [Desulfobulbaceae bacterium]